MIPVVTPDEMAAIDQAAPEPVEVLIARAGSAVAHAALRLLGGAYGRRVIVVTGKGNNGNDGRAAATLLERRGVRCTLVDAVDAQGTHLPAADLVIDAAFGTGFRGDYVAPDPGAAPVLAVDIPSGVDGLTGAPADGAVRAVATVTFAALKPGLLLQPGRALAGRVDVVDIGLDCTAARAHLVTPADVASWVPERPVDAHKWRAAVWVVAGSPGMTGAAILAARGAQRAGAGYVRLSTPGRPAGRGGRRPPEVVGADLPASAWDVDVVAQSDRVRCLVVGPGLGRERDAMAAVRAAVARSTIPVVVDGDGLFALVDGWKARDGAAVVLTPHDGEAERLLGRSLRADRFAEARALAAATGAVVLLKGPTTLVAAPDGRVLAVTAGDARLATAGTGDVLSGVIGALIAQGADPFRAAATGAWLHGRASTLGPARGLVAGDVADLLPAAFDTLERDDDGPHLTCP